MKQSATIGVAVAVVAAIALVAAVVRPDAHRRVVATTTPPTQPTTTKPTTTKPTTTAAATSSTTCDAIGGAELGRDRDWRVVHTGDGGPYGDDYSATPIVACDRHQAGPARVRVLGMAKLTGDGEDYVFEGGPYATGGQIGGDRFVLKTRFEKQIGNIGGDLETGYSTLFDLRRGTSQRLPGSFARRSSYQGRTLKLHNLKTALTAQGALTAVYSTKGGPRAPTKVGPVTVWDSHGRRVLPPHVVAITTATGSLTDDGALYYRSAAGKTKGAELDGAADMDELSVAPKLAWKTLDLESNSYVYEADSRAHSSSKFDIAPLGDVDPDPGFYALWLRYSPSRTAPHRRVSIAEDARDGKAFTRLASGSEADLRVFARTGLVAFVSGRFVGHPKQLRVRLFGVPHRAEAFFDHATSASELPSISAVIGNHRYAIADRRTVRVWASSGGHVYRIAGPHDLAFGATGLYVTDARGKVRLLP